MSGGQYLLCHSCAARQGREFSEAHAGGCYICRGMMDEVEAMAATAARSARRHQFSSFAVGVSLPEGVQEREDELRADLKLKGAETVRTQAARMVAESVSSWMKKRWDRMKPDLTLLVAFESAEVTATSKPLFYQGRYSKPRGVSQRKERCRDCGGGGCRRCKNTGVEPGESVEALLRKKLAEQTGSDRSIFTWLGSEDRESVVYPPGRPFVVEVKNPLKRKVPASFRAGSKGGRVSVSSGRVLPSKVVGLPSFRFRTTIEGVAGARVTKEGVSDLNKAFRNTPVRFDRPYDRPTMKTVYRVSAKGRGRRIWLDVELDGGLPVKRFVSGELVTPSVSEVLKTEVRCRRFDIRKVRVKGRFQLAEIARVEKKN